MLCSRFIDIRFRFEKKEMSSQIVFDTNYLRSLGSKEFLFGQIPEKLQNQIELALNRGDILYIPKTVQIELNAWVRNLSEKESKSIRQAWDLLSNNGYKVIPAFSGEANEIDVFSVIKKKYNEVCSLEPSIDDYIDAENRASYRLPPLPKNPEGEEFRDRIIWSQLVALSKQKDLPILIVSGDRIFENGVNSEEGKDANISIAKTEDELNQWLDQRPPVIQGIIDDILLFRDELLKRNISIEDELIERIIDYRSVREPNGTLVKKFVLILRKQDRLPEKIQGKLLYQGDTPVFVSLQVNSELVEARREMTEQEVKDCTVESDFISSRKQIQEAELKNLIGE
jgi:hypothetical protein